MKKAINVRYLKCEKGWPKISYPFLLTVEVWKAWWQNCVLLIEEVDKGE